ncbi:hypothetical protein [Primorskyibacter sp. S187A]|uniref:hypothetical protein n=1 Tax=Primorskyibacter sp. S187A TaxID=3415130 RepID=UPI003C7DE8EA
MTEVIISLTTIPPRFGGIFSVLESLVAQNAARVVLVVPYHWTRFPDARGVPDLPPGVEVLRAQDQGPASKVLPTRGAYPDADIVFCDDDCLYAPGWLDALRSGPGVCAGSCFDVSRLRRDGARVAQGFAGVYVPASVPLPDHVPDAVRHADDLWLSAWFEAYGHAITEVPLARRLVTPQSAEAPLQTGSRARDYTIAATYIAEHLGIWPPLGG